MNTSTNFDNDREFKLLLNQLIIGSAIGAAFLAVVYIGGLLAHLISGCY